MVAGTLAPQEWKDAVTALTEQGGSAHINGQTHRGFDHVMFVTVVGHKDEIDIKEEMRRQEEARL